MPGGKLRRKCRLVFVVIVVVVIYTFLKNVSSMFGILSSSFLPAHTKAKVELLDSTELINSKFLL